MGTSPVGNHNTFETPLLTQYGILQFIVLRAPATVYLVIGGHHAKGTSILYRALERQQINLAQRTWRNPRIHLPAEVLLVVHGIVFQAHCLTLFLHPSRVSYSKSSAQHGVFTQIFVCAPACRDSLYVYCRTQHHVFAPQTSLYTHRLAVLVGHLVAPRCRKSRARGEVCSGVGGQSCRVPPVRLHLLAYSKRSVCILDVGNAQPWDTRRREHVLAVQHLDLLLERHLSDDAVDGVFPLHQSSL